MFFYIIIKAYIFCFLKLILYKKDLSAKKLIRFIYITEYTTQGYEGLQPLAN